MSGSTLAGFAVEQVHHAISFAPDWVSSRGFAGTTTRVEARAAYRIRTSAPTTAG